MVKYKRKDNQITLEFELSDQIDRITLPSISEFYELEHFMINNRVRKTVELLLSEWSLDEYDSNQKFSFPCYALLHDEEFLDSVVENYLDGLEDENAHRVSRAIRNVLKERKEHYA